jgi:CubicO group peptidase (beta-lactamase class C family)
MYLYDVKWKPGTHYVYGSVNIQLLWDALQHRIGDRTVAKYFEDRVWAPLGAESAATWSLDSSEGGVEKLFGGFNATLRDHARIGALFLHGGVFDGKTIVSHEWVTESLTPDPVPGIVESSDGWVQRGKYQWFLTLDHRAVFAKGYHGQYIFLVPERNMVFLRFGEGYADVDWPALFLRLSEYKR